MQSEGNEVHVSEEEASGGSKEGVVRWVLIIGTLLAVIALSAIWIFGAATRDDPAADYASVDRKIEAQDDAAGARQDTTMPMTDPSDIENDTQEVQNGVPVVENE